MHVDGVLARDDLLRSRALLALGCRGGLALLLGRLLAHGDDADGCGGRHERHGYSAQAGDDGPREKAPSPAAERYRPKGVSTSNAFTGSRPPSNRSIHQQLQCVTQAYDIVQMQRINSVRANASNALQGRLFAATKSKIDRRAARPSRFKKKQNKRKELPLYGSVN